MRYILEYIRNSRCNFRFYVNKCMEIHLKHYEITNYICVINSIKYKPE